MKSADTIALLWFIAINAAAFLAFGFDRWQAGRGGRRVTEFTLIGLASLGGWPGGCLGMMLFRHKTAKLTFKLKYALAAIVFAVELWLWWHWR